MPFFKIKNYFYIDIGYYFDIIAPLI